MFQELLTQVYPSREFHRLEDDLSYHGSQSWTELLVLQARLYKPTNTNSWFPPVKPSIQCLPDSSAITTTSLRSVPVRVADVWLPGRDNPTVPIVPSGVLISRENTVPFVDHLDENPPSEVEKPASTWVRSPT